MQVTDMIHKTQAGYVTHDQYFCEWNEHLNSSF